MSYNFIEEMDVSLDISSEEDEDVPAIQGDIISVSAIYLYSPCKNRGCF